MAAIFPLVDTKKCGRKFFEVQMPMCCGLLHRSMVFGQLLRHCVAKGFSVENNKEDRLGNSQPVLCICQSIFSSELLGYKYPSFRAAARMTPCYSLSFIPAYPDLQDDADHPRCSATG